MQPKTRPSILLVCALIIFSASACMAKVVYVKWDSPGVGDPVTYDGASWETAFHKIGDAISAAVSGDEVWVAAGTYQQNVTLRPGVILKGGYAGTGDTRDTAANTTLIRELNGEPFAAVIGAEGSVIDGCTVQGYGYDPAIKCTGCSCTITNNTILYQGVRLTNSNCEVRANAFSGCGVSSDGGVLVIDNNTFTGGGTSSSGIVCLNATSATITNNTVTHSSPNGISVTGYALITGNTIKDGTYGISCTLQGESRILNNTITDCSSVGLSWASKGNTVIAGNTVVACNTALKSSSYGTSSIPTAYAEVFNNTIVGNNVAVTGGTGYIASTTFKNNIVAFNGIGFRSSLTYMLLSHNDFYNNGMDYDSTIDHATDLSVDPQFANYAGGDFHIQPTSPCRNAGDTTVRSYVDIDMDGQPRCEGTSEDIGADESYGETYTTPIRVVYVNAAATAGGDGTSWEKAYQQIQPAIGDAKAKGGGEVWVAKGTYAPNITMQSFVHIFGGFAGTETVRDQRNNVTNKTIVDGQRDYTHFTGANFSTVDGFVMQNGNICVYCVAVAPIITHNIMRTSRYGVRCSDYACPRIANNIMTGNSYFGVYSGDYASPIITNNTIVSNWGGVGNDMHGTYYLFNDIVAFNYCFGILQQNTTSPSVTKNNDSFGNIDLYTGQDRNYYLFTPGPGDISVDPLFVNKAAADFHVNPESLCVNAGTNAAPGMCSWDMDLQGRIFLNMVDIGADEVVADQAASPAFVPTANGVVFPVDVTITSATDGALIRYTTNGLDPGASDTVVSGPITLSGPGTIKAKAWKTGMIPSAIASAIYTYAENLAASIKTKALNQAATTDHAVISHLVHKDYFYIESDDRSSGIQVFKLNHGMQVGMRVKVTGTLMLSGVEKYIKGTSIVQNGAGTILPLVVSNRDIGGGDWKYNSSTKAGQVGVKEYRLVKTGSTWTPTLLSVGGMNNIGLLVVTTGRVTYVGTGFFYIDDGSGLMDADNLSAGYKGLRINGTVPVEAGVDPIGKLVRVTGSVSLSNHSGIGYRRVYARDVEILQ